MPNTDMSYKFPVDIIMNTVLDGLITIDSRGNIQSFNAAAKRIFQYELDEVLGKNIKILMPEPYHSEHDQYLENYLTTDEEKIIGVGREVSAKRKDGSIFPMELGVNEMLVEGERMFVGTIRDITDRKAVEQDLINETSSLQAVLNTVLDGLLTIDEMGVVQSFNCAAERIFGYKPEEVVGKNVKVLMPEPYHSQHDLYLKNYLNTGEKKVIGIGREVSAKRKDGSVFPMELGINEVDVVGQRMFVGTIRDITERKEAEQAIKSYIEKLKQSNRELDDFAYIASHDLKEPLRGLSNNAAFLEEDYKESLGGDGKRRLDRMKYLCRRMEQLVDDLLHYSRLSRQELAIKFVDLNAIIVDVTSMMESSIVTESVSINIVKPLPGIICDAPRITELFRNLISNAIKYNDKENKVVEIGVEQNALHNGVSFDRVFYVKDNGIGILDEFHEDIFRIFKRLNDEDDSVKGTGVGLTFVKKIIERHRGKIWLESEVGVGTKFLFTLNIVSDNG